VTRPRSLLAVAACLLGLAGCGGSHTATRATTSAAAGATRRTSTVTSTTTAGRGVNASQYAALSQFAGAYVRFLGGAGTAGDLPDATPPVRALARQAGSIPAARRQGTLAMTQPRPAMGKSNSYLLTARDEAHAFYAQMTLVEQHGRWLVAQLTPPDFVQVFAPAGPAPPAPPHGSAGAQDAAQRFLRGYLPWLYGQAPLRAVTNATGGLLARFKTHPPRVPPTMQSPRPRLAGARKHHRRARDLRARAHRHADGRALACQQRQFSPMTGRVPPGMPSSSLPGSNGITNAHVPKGG
jgi:hypothetical protein